MTEYELIDIFGETVGRMWMLLNMWIGISLGYVAFANFGAHSLNVVKIAVLSILYTGFSVLILYLLMLNGAAIEGFHSDLRAMESQAKLSAGTAALLKARENPWGQLLTAFCFLSTYICALAYMPYSYWASKSSDT